MSGLANYASGSSNIGEELRAVLQPSDIASLRERLLGRPVSYWLRWRIENHDLICSFVAATPSGREKLEKFRDHYLLLVMAGVQLCQEVAVLLEAITTPPLTVGGSYREMAALAGDAYNRLCGTNIPYWPFTGLPTPFFDDPSPSTKLDRSDP